MKKTKKIDLMWTTDGLFTTFYVNSNEGLIAYKQIVETCGAPKVLDIHREATIHQLKQAGYTIRKSIARTPKSKGINNNDKKILKALA